jgi:cytidylate kinase
MTSIDAIINRQILKWELERRKAESEPETAEAPAPIITISRQTGSRGSYFGSRLAQKLNYQRLHRELIDVICQSSGYYRRIVESLDDRSRSAIDALVEGMISGQHVDHSDYVRYLHKVIISMSHLGGVIVMGRGANFILGPERGFHIRVVCPRECRIENLVKYREFTPTEAARVIEESDSSRRHFIKSVFKREIDDPSGYDLVLNTALLDVEDLIDVVVLALQAKVNKLRNHHSDGEQGQN